MSDPIWQTKKQQQAFYAVLVCFGLMLILVLIRLAQIYL